MGYDQAESQIVTRPHFTIIITAVRAILRISLLIATPIIVIDFKTPWNFLAEMPAQARAFGAGAVNSGVNQMWWT